jgi:hypothetical protein
MSGFGILSWRPAPQTSLAVFELWIFGFASDHFKAGWPSEDVSDIESSLVGAAVRRQFQAQRPAISPKHFSNNGLRFSIACDVRWNC